MIDILIFVAYYNGVYKYEHFKIPANVIQATYVLEPSRTEEKCFVSLKKLYKEHAYLVSNETCDQINKKVFDKK